MEAESVHRFQRTIKKLNKDASGYLFIEHITLDQFEFAKAFLFVMFRFICNSLLFFLLLHPCLPLLFTITDAQQVLCLISIEVKFIRVILLLLD